MGKVGGGWATRAAEATGWEELLSPGATTECSFSRVVPGHELGQRSGSYPNLGSILERMQERDKEMVAEGDLLPVFIGSDYKPHRKMAR